MFKQKSNTTTNERKNRGQQQRIYLVLTHAFDDKILERQYDVMGTTGNVYSVRIEKTPTCTCPDYQTRHNRCKHIYFVLSRIMKVKSDQEDIKEYTDADLIDMFSNVPQITETLKVGIDKMIKYNNLKNRTINGEVPMKKLHEDDICPICLGDIYDCNEPLIFCRYSCGTPLHEDCFVRYTSHQKNQSYDAIKKCLFCLKPWEKDKNEGQYVNLN